MSFSFVLLVTILRHKSKVPALWNKEWWMAITLFSVSIYFPENYDSFFKKVEGYRYFWSHL